MKRYRRLVLAMAVMAAAWLVQMGIRFRLPPPESDGSTPPASAVPPAGHAARNLLLVTLDTTRADRLGCYGYRPALTPTLDALAARGTLFEQAFTSCPQTLPAHATILTGLDPAEHGLRINGKNRLAAEVPTLGEILAGRGYRTGAFVAAFVLHRTFGLGRGFESYDDDLSGAPRQEVSEPLSVYRPGDVVTDAALRWLDRTAGQERPFFAWVHLYDPHYPYHAHRELQGTAYQDIASYDAEVAFSDRQIGRLLAFLDEHHLRGDTLVVVVADHGEGLGDHGEVEHGYLLNEEALRVPLIMALPGVIREGQRVGAIVSLIDLVPTLLDVLAVPGVRAGRGRSLAGALRGEPIDSVASYAETDLALAVYGWSGLRSLTTLEWKYIRSPRPELYDRHADPHELYNLAGARPDHAAEREEALRAIERMHVTPTPAPAVALLPEHRARLEALGYVASAALPPPARPDAPAPASSPSRKDIKDVLGIKRLDLQLWRRISTGTIAPEEIVPIARRLVAASPETALFHARLGAALLNEGQLDEAAAELHEAIRLQPDLVDALENLGSVLARQGRFDDAVARYTDALRLEPDRVRLYLRLGDVLADRGHLDMALGYYLEFARNNPESADVQLKMGIALARRAKQGEALARFAEAVRLAPTRADAHYHLANLLADRGESESAIAHYREALRLQPDLLEARNGLAATLAGAGQRDAAEAEYAAVLRVRPDFAHAHYGLATLLAARNEPGPAMAHYEEAIRLAPDWAEPHERLAWLLATCTDPKRRNPVRAVVLAEQAVQLTERSDPQPMGTLALVYDAAGRRADALTTARRALGLAHATERDELARHLEEWIAEHAIQ